MPISANKLFVIVDLNEKIAANVPENINSAFNLFECNIFRNAIFTSLTYCL